MCVTRIRDGNSYYCEEHDYHAQAENACESKLLRPRKLDTHGQIHRKRYDHCIGNEIYRCAVSKGNQTAVYVNLSLMNLLINQS